jgi:hypothetical protein
LSPRDHNKNHDLNNFRQKASGTAIASLETTESKMRTPNFIANSVFTLGFCALFGACLEHPVKPVIYDKGEVVPLDLPIDDNRDVDILFVIDNSGSMAEEQARLARNFPAFVARLEDMGADYRIGITTTDVKHPGCQNGATPENGNLVLRSCTETIGEGAFKWNDLDEASACTDQCQLGADQLRIEASADGQTHAWLESIGGDTNLPDGTAVGEAFGCFGPQGINGCGFESPLEAMKLAIDKARAENGNGFMRDESLLSVVLVTDEADCSSNPAHEDIFTTNTTFQNEEGVEPRRSSATCWRAGTACTGEGQPFAECHAEDYGADGTPGVTAADDAVLHPVDRYIDYLEGLRALPGEPGDDGRPLAREVLMSLIAGVPEGYDSGKAEITYALAEAGSQQAINFGIAPGCTNTSDGSNSTAVPPVREREVAEAFAGADGERNVYSICQDDYSPALEQIAAQLQKIFKPACAGVCIEDREPATPELDPLCLVSASQPDGGEEDVPACEFTDGAWAVPAGAQVCFYMLTDPDGRTEFAGDDMTILDGEDAAYCSTDTDNLEFRILRTGPRSPRVTYHAQCVVADDKSSCARD